MATLTRHVPYLVKRSAKDFLTRYLWSFSEYSEQVVEDSLIEVIGWISVAQQSCGGRGVPAAFTLHNGYSPPDPGTSGYIITSLLSAHAYFQDENLKSSAKAIADWLIGRQLESGAMRCNIEPLSNWEKKRVDCVSGLPLYYWFTPMGWEGSMDGGIEKK